MSTASGGLGRPRLDEVVARLERELRSRQQQLLEETARNARAKAQLLMLSALARANEAITQLLAAAGAAGNSAAGAAGAPAAAQQALDALEAELSLLVEALQASSRAGSNARPPRSQEQQSVRRSGPGECEGSATASSSHAQPAGSARGGGGSGGGGGSSSGSGRRVVGGGGMPGLLFQPSVCLFLQEIVSGRELVKTKADFVAWWRARVMHLALQAHQYRSGGVSRERLEKIVYEMAVGFGVLFLYGNYALEVIVLNMETGLPCEAPQSVWDRVAACLGLDREQAALFCLLNRWWKTTTQSFSRERQQLAEAALASPQDLELQEAVASGLARVNAAYLAAAVAVLAVTLFGVTRPEQVAASWIACWPRMPLMTAIFEAVERQRSI
ncbi:hypothetical protein Rsub_10400 [Raphidocelis subcapitata]|uniref:Uncharacterized protein n=1 Tax=Raphidocelis subcapitata TaxID=307507 RepID=A0A2V0PJJ1_9CHLO|nr:hypothetical protein Rsub_10400 [Raphidocelis subcapitata]|eukprot:GBF97477.1 hypothetical protein Rsub_10400 [Raphidocelis subcapitata]